MTRTTGARCRSSAKTSQPAVRRRSGLELLATVWRIRGLLNTRPPLASDRHDLPLSPLLFTTPRRRRLVAATVSMMFAAMGALPVAGSLIPDVLSTLTPLSVLRVLSPAVVLLTTLSLLPTRPSTSDSPSPITPVVVAVRSPRRALILSLLSLVSFTFFLDGLTFVIYAVLEKKWPKGTGVEIGALEGVIGFAGLAALGAWKDVQGVEVWLMKRVKTGLTLAFFLDIAQVVLLTTAVKSKSYK